MVEEVRQTFRNKDEPIFIQNMPYSVTGIQMAPNAWNDPCSDQVDLVNFM